MTPPRACVYKPPQAAVEAVRVLVCGSRSALMEDAICLALARLPDGSVVIHGGATVCPECHTTVPAREVHRALDSLREDRT